MARFKALRGALEEDPFLGGGPIGVSEDNAPIIDYGDTTMARASGLRARPPIAADWREKEAERLARENLDAERLVPSPEMLSRVAERSRDPAMKLIPVKNASVRTDAPAASASALPTVTSDQPAGKPDISGKDGMVSPPSEGAGGDTSERDLYLARLAAQSAAGFGGMGAGKNIDMGIADTLGERLKQVQALRAKREEQSLEQQRERATWGASNRGTLNSLLAQYKDNPAVSAALMALEPSLETTKPSDFQRASTSAIMTRPKAEGIQATTGKTLVQIPDIRAGTAGKVAKAEDIPKNAATRDALRKAQEDLARARAAALSKARVDVTTSSKEARAARGDIRAAEVAVTRAMERANDKNDVTNTANNFTALEEVAPGFAKGRKPDWIGRFTLQKAMEVPAISDKAAALNSALENFTANIRKTLFGASLTGNEKASFDLIVNRRLTATPEQLASAINTLRRGAARFAQNHFTSSMEFHPDETARVLRSSAIYGPALREGGIYSDVWTLPVGPTAAGSTTSAGVPSSPPPGAIEKLKANPSLKAAFDAKYGAGSADKALGGK